VACVAALSLARPDDRLAMTFPCPQPPETKRLPRFGALADRVKDQLVVLEEGFLYASPWVVSETARFSASIVITVSDERAFEFSSGGPVEPCQAVVTRPYGERRLGAKGVPIVSIGISPHHPSYRLFRSLGDSGSLSMPRSLFSQFDADMQALYDGRASLADAQALFDAVVAAVVRQLPSPHARDNDPRIRRVLRMLQGDPGAGLDALAAVSGLSYDRMSHLFIEEVGLPLRSYQLAQKMHLATQLVGSGLSLTAIAVAAGFTDSAHFSKVWLKAYGGSPTHFFSNERVEVKTVFRPPSQPFVRA
jgi:AraC family transcriptional regulator, arabinose operon regulatory protein